MSAFHEHRLQRVGVLGLGVLLSVGLIVLALAAQPGTIIPPSDWTPVKVAPGPTETQVSGWWRTLPTPAPVYPGPDHDPTEEIQ